MTKSKVRKDEKREMAISIAKQIARWQRLATAFDEIVNALRTPIGNRIETGNVYELLIQRELDEWRRLCLWGLTLEQEDLDRIKAAAYNRFLRDDMSVSRWLSPDGSTPSMWLEADEQEFREMARKLFAPKDGKDGEKKS